MNDVVIRAEGLGKRYRIGERQQYKALRDTLTDALSAPVRLGASIVRSRFTRNGHQPEDNHIWALKDVSFEIKQGEVVGVIGRNGSGKSTLLKVLSRITEPTEGHAEIHGRVGSLLEVGTGFHPELTGRENIYLNGAILGMKRREIQRKFGEIVDFAEIERFIDTPVKHYSSGMYVRLAFAVAAHLEPEILLVDEVLAVGDAAFQKKCLGKMGEVAKEGRTVLFVSHNMGAITRLCKTCVWLDEGSIQKQDQTLQVVSAYLKEGISSEAQRYWHGSESPGDDSLELKAVRICQPSGILRSAIDITNPFEIEIEVEVLKAIAEIAIAIRILSVDGQIVLHTSDVISDEPLAMKRGRRISSCQLPPYTLNAGTYMLNVGADIPNNRMIFNVENVLGWSVEAASSEMGRYTPTAWKGIIGAGLAKWSIRQL